MGRRGMWAQSHANVNVPFANRMFAVVTQYIGMQSKLINVRILLLITKTQICQICFLSA